MYGPYFICHRLLGLVHRLYALYKSGLYEVSTKTIRRNLFIDRMYVYTLCSHLYLYIVDMFYIRWILHLGIVYEYKIRWKNMLIQYVDDKKTSDGKLRQVV